LSQTLLDVRSAIAEKDEDIARLMVKVAQREARILELERSISRHFTEHHFSNEPAPAQGPIAEWAKLPKEERDRRIDSYLEASRPEREAQFGPDSVREEARPEEPKLCQCHHLPVGKCLDLVPNSDGTEWIHRPPAPPPPTLIEERNWDCLEGLVNCRIEGTHRHQIHGPYVAEPQEKP
jgi:hypothetical protein